jgi:CRP-like cAMP-binding protein
MNYELKLYDQLLQFSLFQGMSRGDLMEVAGHTKFDFVKMPPGKRIIAEGDVCSHLFFLINGTILAETTSDDHVYRVHETLSAPCMLQPERLFGVWQRYTTTFKTETDCNFLVIDKQEVVLLLETQLVFRLNMLNLMATKSQRSERYPWRPAPKSLRERIVRFFIQHSLYPAGPKTFHILMKRLAEEVNDSRLDVSGVLNEMQQEGLIVLYRGRIEIPMLERLLM